MGRRDRATAGRARGWAEITGGASTSHNTFNALRALEALCAHGLLDEDDFEQARTGVRRWLDTNWRSLGAARVIDAGFAVRLVALVDRTDERASELVEHLASRANEALDAASDAYDTEVLALALLEWSRCADRAGVEASWRWALPRLLPPFARGGTDLYDVLYQLHSGRRWRTAIDWFVRTRAIEAIGGRVLGTIAALAIVDDRAARYFAAPDRVAVATLLTVMIAGAVAVWVAMSFFASVHRGRVAWSLFISLVLGALIADVNLPQDGAIPLDAPLVRIALVLLCSLIIDLVSYTADRTSFVARFLPAD